MGDHFEAKIVAVGARSRRLLIDAAVCFVATSLVAFLPPQWKNGEALKEIVFTTDPVSGKIIDRIDSAEAARPSVASKGAPPAPALFALYPVALRKPSSEKRNPVESASPASPTYNAEPPAPPQPMGENAELQERGLLAKLDPTGLSSKLAPLGRKAWNGATSLGDAVSGLVSAYHF